MTKTREQLLEETLVRLLFEAIHFKTTGVGRDHLNRAIEYAEQVLLENPKCKKYAGYITR